MAKFAWKEVQGHAIVVKIEQGPGEKYPTAYIAPAVPVMFPTPPASASPAANPVPYITTNYPDIRTSESKDPLFCPFCGARRRPSAHFCELCGGAL